MASHVHHDRTGLPPAGQGFPARRSESSLPGWRSWLGALAVVAAFALVLLALYR